jgi:hypothetical protein
MSGETKPVGVAPGFMERMFESLSKEVQVLRKELDWYKGENARLECKIEEMEGR